MGAAAAAYEEGGARTQQFERGVPTTAENRKERDLSGDDIRWFGGKGNT